MLRNAILALIPLSMVALGQPAAAIEILGQGENFAVSYDNPAQNVGGGGTVSVTRKGEGMRIDYAPDAPAQPPRIAQFVGQGESGTIRYLPATPAPSLNASAAALRG